MIGNTLGRYTVVERLGRGGMGEVWRAEDPVLSRNVALKILPPEFSELPVARARFLREAKVASSLKHPGIAAVFDAGEEENRLFIAFELIEGSSVSELVEREGPLQFNRIADIGGKAAEALSHAHESGVAHRDITGGNILVTEDDRVVVVDFGLALPEGATRFTLTGMVMGTASYMSPEVARGEIGDFRSDIYGLGTVLYEMLVGGPPFSGISAHDVLRAVVGTPAKPPGAFRDGIPRDLERLVMTCLAKKPNERYGDMKTLARELDAIRTRKDGIHGNADPPQTAVRSRPPSQVEGRPGTRRSTITATLPGLARWRDLGLSLILLLALIGGFRKVDPFDWWSLAGKYSSLAVLPLENVSPVSGNGEYLNQGLGSGLAGRLSYLPGFRVPGWQTSRRFTRNASTLKSIAGDLGVELLLTGRFSKEQDTISGVLVIMDTVNTEPIWGPVKFTDTVDRFLDLETAMAEAVAGELALELTDRDISRITRLPTQIGKAYDLYLRGMEAFQRGTESAIGAAQGYADQALDLDPRLAEAYVLGGAARLERSYRSFQGGREDLDRAEEDFRTALVFQPDLTDARRGLIHILFHDGRVRELLELARDDASETAEGLLTRAEAYHFGGLNSKGADLFQKVLEVEPANSAAAYYHVISLGWSGQEERTIDAGKRFMEIYGDDPDVHQVLGGAYLELGDHERARFHYEKSNDPASLGGFLLDIGESEEAHRVLGRGLESAIRKLAASPGDTKTRIEKAMYHAMLGETVEFEREADRLLRENPDNEYVRVHLVPGYLRLQKHERVESLIRESITRERVLEVQVAYRYGLMNVGEFLTSPRYRILRNEYEGALQKLRETF